MPTSRITRISYRVFLPSHFRKATAMPHIGLHHHNRDSSSGCPGFQRGRRLHAHTLTQAVVVCTTRSLSSSPLTIRWCTQSIGVPIVPRSASDAESLFNVHLPMMRSLPESSLISYCAMDGLCSHRETTCHIPDSPRRPIRICRRSPTTLEYHYLYLLRRTPSSCVLQAMASSTSRMLSTTSTAAWGMFRRLAPQSGALQSSSLHLRLPLRPLRGEPNMRRARGDRLLLRHQLACFLLFLDSAFHMHNRCMVLPRVRW